MDESDEPGVGGLVAGGATDVGEGSGSTGSLTTITIGLGSAMRQYTR